MRSLHLKPLKSPFVDAENNEIWEGNYLLPSKGLQIFTKEVIFERGKWWVYDLAGFYIDRSNRYKPLTEAEAKTKCIVDDRVTLR